MTTVTLERPQIELGRGDGGMPARQAVVRWAWRLFRREWRQQLLVLLLIVVAVAATFVGATVAVNTRLPANEGFGKAQDLAILQGASAGGKGPVASTPSRLRAEIAAIQHRFGTVDVIENETISIPGSIDTYNIRAQDPNGAFGQPMLSLLSGHYPVGPDQVALTSGLASTLGLHLGDVWHQGGQSREVVGIVQNPQSLLDEFALVAPGQVTQPSSVTVLFDAHGFNVAKLGANFESIASVAAAQSNAINPTTILLSLVTIGMLLIALVAVGGFTVLAQRRLRSIGMLGAVGATDKNIKLVVRANGVIVGVVGALIGVVLGFVIWLAYRPHLETSSHHLFGVFALPWGVIGASVLLAVIATYFAASRPAKAMTRVPIVAALAGRPAPPRQVHRSAIPGLVILVIGFFLLGVAGGGQNGGGAGFLVIGLVLVVVAVILLSPLALSLLARLSHRGPIAGRLAVRDLARYRARSGSALSAISIGVLIAVVICIVAAARYGNVLDYAGPNLANNQLIVYTPNSFNGPGPLPTAEQMAAAARSAESIGAGLGTHDVVELQLASAQLIHAARGRNFSGQLYVATPQLLRAFGISQSSIDPSADVLSMRPGFSSISDMQLVYGNFGNKGGPPPGNGPPTQFPCPKGSCLANPVIQEVAALPSGTSAPNTLVTEHAIRTLGLESSVSTQGWLIQADQPLTASQISGARLTASQAGMTIETKNDQPDSSVIINWATVFGFVLALGILAMTIGLIRSETASDLRILTATGASSYTRRTLTGVTAGALGLLGAVVGTIAGYVATIGFLRTNSLNGLSSLSSVPVKNLLVILIGIPLVAFVGGWLLAGREPPAIAHQPLE